MKLDLHGLSVFVGSGGSDWVESAPTLLLQHGAGMNRTVWVLLARYFSRHGFNIVAPDLPGHGASRGSALGSLEEQAAFVWRLIDELRAHHGLPDTELILGGHSMGALVASEAAGQRPDSVAQLLLFGVGYPMPVAEPLLAAAKANDQAAVDMIALFSHAFRSQIGANPVAGLSVQNSAMALLEQAADGVLYADLLACNRYQGAEKASQALGQGKTAIIAGGQDRMTPTRAMQNFADLLGADVYRIPDSGHMMMSEQPEKTLQAARQVLEPYSALV